ncbi:unnamed protein product [Clonostachys byssicola]|uniref:Large ribosomal subunit protein mL46 n=1 Tax=Clonostachys byssicola TaxID=160290 RepID=A0A9N9XUC7_9HYPO|nr:unnamed protein product [Clonostachys byssicola]
MAASGRGARVFKGSLISNPSSICSRCATTYTRTPGRLYSSTASTTTTSAASEQTPTPSPGAYDIRSGLILTRPPLLTRTLHPFENAFFFYQKRLEERLNTPFVTNVYFKPDTARRIDWDLKVKERQGTVAKELGVYHGKSAAAWDDELRVGDGLSSQESIVGAILKDAEARVSDDAEIIPAADVQPVEPPNERLSEADKKADVKRLDRAMDRTLYLVVKGKDGWSFPADVIPDGENLHQCAQRVLDQAAGVNMNTWIVGRVPVAHTVKEPVRDASGGVKSKGAKTFFLKGRIMAGQADLKDNPFGYTDFKWLTREELEKELSPQDFKGVRNMMSDR